MGISNDGKYFAADSYQCPWNITWNETYLQCTESAAESIYIDPNLVEGSYRLCQPSWIGDGICDDTCMVSECGYDLGDCSEVHGCSYDGCLLIYRAWEYFADENDRTWFNHSFVCDTMYPLA